KLPALLAIGFTAGVVFALPALLLRKTVKGLYDCTIGPIINCACSDKPFSGWKVLNGFLNVATLGVFGLIKKLAKSCIGYTQRFGFLNNGTDDFSIVQNTFKDAIDLATK